MLALAQDLCETDGNGNKVRIVEDKKNGIQTFRTVVKRVHRVFVNYTHIRQHRSPNIDYMHLVMIKKERRAAPSYTMVLYNGQKQEICEVSRFQFLLVVMDRIFTLKRECQHDCDVLDVSGSVQNRRLVLRARRHKSKLHWQYHH